MPAPRQFDRTGVNTVGDRYCFAFCYRLSFLMGSRLRFVGEFGKAVVASKYFLNKRATLLGVFAIEVLTFTADTSKKVSDCHFVLAFK